MAYLQLNGCNLHYTDQGEGEPVLLIHGLGSSERDWEYQLPALLPGYRVLCLDMRGHGKSEKPKGGYSVKTFAEDCLAFIAFMQLSKPHIVGISMGGMIAFQLATDRPDVPASLTIVNSGPELIPRHPREYLLVAQRLFFAHVLPLSAIAKGLATTLFPKSEQQDILDPIICPVLVISADKDYTPVEKKREYVSRLGDARLEVIEDSRHGTPIDQADKFNALLLDFLAQSGSAAPAGNAG